mgnify:CR=1 FL=1
MPERPAAPALQLTSPFAQILIACAALCALAVVLWHAETEAVGLSRLFGDAGIQTVSLDEPAARPINDGRLVHAEGEARATLPVQDTDLDVIFSNTLVVERHVEMYQWHEVPNGPSYKYVTRWSSQWQDPARFRVPAPHTNPAFNLPTQRFAATDAKLGAFRLPDQTAPTLDHVPSAAQSESKQLFAVDPSLSFFVMCQSCCMFLESKDQKIVHGLDPIPVTFRIKYLDTSGKPHVTAVKHEITFGPAIMRKDHSEGTGTLTLASHSAG